MARIKNDGTNQEGWTNIQYGTVHPMKEGAFADWPSFTPEELGYVQVTDVTEGLSWLEPANTWFELPDDHVYIIG